MLKIILLFLIFSRARCELISAAVLFRHGDRSPLHTYPSDRNPPSSWPHGLGHLTHRGQLQTQELGTFLRQRYVALLKKRDPMMRSTHTSRTLASARNCIAGLFHLPVKNVSLERPLRVISPPVTEDKLLRPWKGCSRMRFLNLKALSSPRAVSELRSFSTFLSWLGSRSGLGPDMSLSGASAVRDVLFCSRAHKLPLPKWLTPKVWQQLSALKELSWNLRFRHRAQRRLQGGPLLSEVLLRFADDAAVSSGKLRLYSAHDSNVAALLSSMHLFSGKSPPYASAVLMELHMTNGRPQVEIFFRNSSTVPPYRLSVASCGPKCLLSDLRRKLRPELLSVLSVRKSCMLRKSSHSFFGISTMVMAVLCAAAVVCLFSLLRRARTPRYSRVPTESP